MRSSLVLPSMLICCLASKLSSFDFEDNFLLKFAKINNNDNNNQRWVKRELVILSSAIFPMGKSLTKGVV